MAIDAIVTILEKMTAKDKDFRYMATSDLLNQLSKEGFKLDAEWESKLANALLQQLDDVSGDVSGLAVKCMPPLVKKLRDEVVLEMANNLCDKLLNVKNQHHDITSIALKAVVAEVDSVSAVKSVVSAMTPKLIKGFSATDTEVKCECVDVLSEVLQKHGNSMVSDHQSLLAAMLPLLSSNPANVRKKAVSCIASLASSLSDKLLAKATREVVKLLLGKNLKPEFARTNIQMIGALSRAVGYRFGSHLGDTVPVLASYCRNASENDEELREYSLQALESFLVTCPGAISPYCDEILGLTLEYLSYDPNYSDDMEEDTDNEEEEEEEEEDDDDEYNDDDDVSWKVRRASAKCLAALIVSRPEMLGKFYEEACPKMIDRFKEREENVKMDVFTTFIELLRVTTDSTCKTLLKQEVPKIVRSINRQLREKSVKTQVGAFSVLKELVVVLPDSLADQIGSLVPGIEKALLDKSSTSSLKLEALTFTRLVLASHNSRAFHPYVKAISAPVLSAVAERYYKVAAEALRVCEELVRVVRPNLENSGFDFKPYVHPMYSAVMARLANQDQDQEVKECAITCMGLVVSAFGDHLQADKSLRLFADRMGNETTRLTAVKAFAVIAASPLRLDLSCVLNNVVSELTGFLRKTNRSLREATLGALNTLLVGYGDKIGSSAYQAIIVELSSLINDSDLQITALALEICCTLMSDKRTSASLGSSLRNKVLPQALALLRSSLLQGQALQSLQRFFAALVQSANTSFDSLLEALVSAAASQGGGDAVSKQALASIASCVAPLCLAAGQQKCSSTVTMLANILRDDSADSGNKKHLALLSLGEIGRRTDLSSHHGIEKVVVESFQAPYEEVKSAASYALGNIAVGNLQKYLPFILDQIDNRHKKQYLLLHSLKEVILQSVELPESSVEKIVKLLFNHTESEEEGVRNVVAECLGKLALIEPRKLVPELKERAASRAAALTRATVVTAIKYAIVERAEKIDAILQSEMASFLSLIEDHDRHVRRATVLALSTAAHNKPSLIKNLLPQLLPLLYEQAAIKQEMIRVVDLGPFKHTIDDGLELRKAAFECVYTLLDKCLGQMEPSPFIVPYLKSGLGDQYDVKMTCHLILSRLADRCPSAVLASLDSLVDHLQETVSFKTRANAAKQEVDRNEDMVRSALRAVASLNRVSGVDCSQKFKNLMLEISKSHQDKYASIQNEQ